MPFKGICMEQSQLVFIVIIAIALAAVLLVLVISKNNENYLLRKKLNASQSSAEAIQESYDRAAQRLNYCNEHHVDQGALSIITLIFCNDEHLQYIEQQVGMTRNEAVDSWIEDSAWGESLTEFLGHKGTDKERLDALRNVIVN